MTLRDTIINAVAGTIVLAAGGSIVSLKVNDAKQDERIARIEQLNTDVKGLRVDLQTVDGKLEWLQGRLDTQEPDHGSRH